VTKQKFHAFLVEECVRAVRVSDHRRLNELRTRDAFVKGVDGRTARGSLEIRGQAHHSAPPSRPPLRETYQIPPTHVAHAHSATAFSTPRKRTG